MRKFTAVLAAVLIVANVSAANARSCPTYQDARSNLERVLAARSYPKPERAFLLIGADRQVRELKRNALNEQGQHCGIETARAHVLGCVAADLPRVASPDRKTGATFWGKVNVSAREAAFIGKFHACRGAAMKYLFKY
jgi:hypothetical protein